MNQILSDEEITMIVRECAKSSAINRDGSTSHRIARAVIAAYEEKLHTEQLEQTKLIRSSVPAKMNSTEPVAWQTKYLPIKLYTHDNLNPQWDMDDLCPLYLHPLAPSAVEWISVDDERKPKYGQHVAVLTTNVDDDPVAIMANYNGGKLFLSIGGKKVKPVTYWMALPNPPVSAARSEK